MDNNLTLAQSLSRVANTVPITYSGNFLTAQAELSRTLAGGEPSAAQVATLLSLLADDLRTLADHAASTDDALARTRHALSVLKAL